jgi:hypothetical protein
LSDGNGERRAVIYHRMFAKENDLAGRGCFHER